MALLGRIVGFGSRSAEAQLEDHLKSATEASWVQEVPRSALLALVQYSYNAGDRQTIMRYLARCLSEPAASRWRRVFLALQVIEELLRSGSTDLVKEIRSGHHFDLAQRLSMLKETFRCAQDVRGQNVVRQKACVVGNQFQGVVQEQEAAEKIESVKKEAPGRRRRMRRQWVRTQNCVEFTQHNDDTTDEEDDSSDEEVVTMPAHQDVKGTICGSAMVQDETSTTDSDSSELAREAITERRNEDGPVAFKRGDVCRAISEVTMREGESFESEEYAMFPPNAIFVILGIGIGRRIRVREASTWEIGWISVRTKDGIPLVALGSS
eukprot:TRINITY_DN74037_c0_g1_i1.p1 TRINITY_DN74037_c0_g1~~TRINITY_DN74037_c0_g1_i1.p1  ORF type:complete len:331 (+),score=69.29 TRINITY_DN74037_c0_g1_i1:27-995(+)